mgnify:CR=1 FL=1
MKEEYIQKYQHKTIPLLEIQEMLPVLIQTISVWQQLWVILKNGWHKHQDNIKDVIKFMGVDLPRLMLVVLELRLLNGFTRWGPISMMVV